MDQKIRIHVTCKKIKNKKNWGNLGGRREYTDAVKEQKAQELFASIWRTFFEGIIRFVLHSAEVPQEAMSPLSLEEFKQSG